LNQNLDTLSDRTGNSVVATPILLCEFCEKYPDSKKNDTNYSQRRIGNSYPYGEAYCPYCNKSYYKTAHNITSFNVDYTPNIGAVKIWEINPMRNWCLQPFKNITEQGKIREKWSKGHWGLDK